MDKEKDFLTQADFIEKLRNNSLSTPNAFTKGMGLLIKNAREDMNITQSEFAKKLNRRQATISDIENGKSDIGVLTLVQICVELQKPISYFFPESLLKNFVLDVKTPYEQKFLEMARRIEFYDDAKLPLEVLDILAKHIEDTYEYAMEHSKDPEIE